MLYAYVDFLLLKSGELIINRKRRTNYLTNYKAFVIELKFSGQATSVQLLEIVVIYLPFLVMTLIYQAFFNFFVVVLYTSRVLM
jgi:hypothetical protein